MEKINHSFDLSVDNANGIEILSRASYFAAAQEKVDDGGFDCGGTLGSAGSFGGTLGTFGCFGCCC
jgi:hypothetical protein